MNSVTIETLVKPVNQNIMSFDLRDVNSFCSNGYKEFSDCSDGFNG